MKRLIIGAMAFSLCHASLSQTGDAAPTPPPPEIVEQLHDVREPVAFEPSWRTIDYVVAIGFGLGLAGLALAVWATRRKKEQPAIPEPPAQPHHEIALRKLRELRGRRLGDSEELLMLADEIPQILKEFVDATYRAESVCQTTRETRDSLLNSLPQDLTHRATWLMIACDRVKFAGRRAFSGDPIDEAEELVRGIHRWADRGEAS